MTETQTETHRRTSWLDVIAPLLLTGIALTGLEGSYADRTYLVVGGLGALMATSVVVLAWTQERSRGELLLALLVLFAPLGAMVCRHDGDVVTIPGIESMSAVVTGAFTGPAELLSTIPPADPVGAPLTLTFILGYIIAAACAAAALFGRRPVAPVLPAVLGVAVTALLGVQDPDFLAWRAAAFAVVALVWSAVRGQRQVAGSPGLRGAAIRGLASLVVVVGITGLLSSLVDEPPQAEGSQRWVLRGQVGKGEDVSRLDNPLSDFRSFTRQLPGTPGNVYNETLFEVAGLPSGTPMRFVTLDVYDGMEWHADNRTVPDQTDALFLRIGSEVAAPLPGRRIEVEVTLRQGYTGSWLPLAGQLTGITFTYLDGRAQREDVRYNPATLTAMVRGGLVRRDDYAFTAVLPASTLKVGMSPYRRGRSQPEGRFLDSALEPWRGAALSPMERVFSLADYLRTNGRYSDGAESWERQFEAGHDRERLGDDFFEAAQMVGNHEQYTAFMALAANRLGVPARVVVGAVPTRDGTVSGSDVTTWVEIRVSDGSWRILPSDVYLSTRAPRRSEPAKQDPDTFVEAAEEKKAKEEKPPTVEPEREQLRPVTEPADSPVPEILLGVLGALLVIGWIPGTKWLRRRRRRGSASTAVQVEGAWQELIDLARDLGHDVPASAPRPQQALAMGRAGDAARIADEVFAPVEPSRETADTIWSLVEDERRALIAEGGVRARLRAWWHPASLTSGGLRRAVRGALSAQAPREPEVHVDGDALAR